jgi:hypothetical protein
MRHYIKIFRSVSFAISIVTNYMLRLFYLFILVANLVSFIFVLNLKSVYSKSQCFILGLQPKLTYFELVNSIFFHLSFPLHFFSVVSCILFTIHYIFSQSSKQFLLFYVVILLLLLKLSFFRNMIPII